MVPEDEFRGQGVKAPSPCILTPWKMETDTGCGGRWRFQGYHHCGDWKSIFGLEAEVREMPWVAEARVKPGNNGLDAAEMKELAAPRMERAMYLSSFPGPWLTSGIAAPISFPQ